MAERRAGRLLSPSVVPLQKIELCPATGQPHRLVAVPFDVTEADIPAIFGPSRKLRCQDCGREVYEWLPPDSPT